MNDAPDIFDLGAVFRVMPENVTPLWPQLEALFRPGLAMVSTHEPEDVRRAVMSGRAQLWVQMVLNEAVAAATTEFIEYPKGMFVRVWLVGAIPERKMERDRFLEALDVWRKANGCVGFEWIGRPGWARLYPDARVEGLVMRWIIDDV